MLSIIRLVHEFFLIAQDNCSVCTDILYSGRFRKTQPSLFSPYSLCGRILEYSPKGFKLFFNKKKCA